ncbi:hypothetical protein J6590_068854 [Homalodisca vitripennis]|nr:hypothetical protein J6590_068854 [Homalodisca vitripennis]
MMAAISAPVSEFVQSSRMRNKGSQEGSLLAGLYFLVEPTLSTAKTDLSLINLGNLMMSRSGTTLTEKIRDSGVQGRRPLSPPLPSRISCHSGSSAKVSAATSLQSLNTPSTTSPHPRISMAFYRHSSDMLPAPNGTIGEHLKTFHIPQQVDVIHESAAVCGAFEDICALSHTVCVLPATILTPRNL